MNLPVGTLLRGGTYRIVRFIDSGGFGRTYEAEHLMLQKRVAIKEFFVKDFCTRNENTSYVVVGIKSKEPLVDKLKSKFVDEARAVSRFRHAGIVQVSDVFEENGTAYYVMDYIEGSSLKDIVRSEGPLSERRALKYIFQVADALKYVHEHNRLHLDVKPGNIMVDGSDNAILIDFGTSKQYDEVSGENTSTLLGHTPGYAPPEQMSKSVMNFLPATDIYALGAALYNLLTGKTPPDANDRISGTMLDPLPASVSDCVRRAVEESMRLNKSQRPQCIEEFLAILRGGEQAKSETKQARPSGTSRPADDSTVWYENNNVGGASNERRSDKGGRSGGGNDKVAKGGVSDKPSSSPNRAKRWIIVACVIVGLIAGFFLLKSLSVKKKAAEADGAAAKDSTESVSGLAFDPAQLPEEPIFEIKTNMGTITVKLYSDTPKHRDNFVKLASERFYDGILFHRVIKGFVIQTGDPLTKDIANKARFGTGGPEDGHEIPAEIVPGHSHIKGALAAARKGDQANPMKNSSGSQFYIVENPDACKHLDGQYTIFGETVDGFDVIDRIAAVQTDARDCPVENIVIISIMPRFW